MFNVCDSRVIPVFAATTEAAGYHKLSTNTSIRSSVCNSRVFSVFAGTIEPAGHHELTHYADWRVSFSKRGEVVLADEDLIYLYEHDGVDYRAKKTRIPDGVERHCYKAVSDTTIFAQHWEDDSPTHLLHIKDLHHMGRHDYKGRLRGVLCLHTLVYGQKRDWDDYIVALHQPDGKIILQPPCGRNWGPWMSVCKAGKCMVVVENNKQTMDVFSSCGNILLLFCHLNESVMPLKLMLGLIIL